MESKVAVIVPAYNEESSIGEVISGIRKVLPDALILVVDDGSSDNTSSIVRDAGAVLLRLSFNIGYGSALQTGYMYAAEKNVSYCIQMDADGQHNAESLPDILNELEKGDSEFVIGVRKFCRDGSGYRAGYFRRAGISFFAAVSSLISGEKLTDTTSGFLGFSDKLLDFFTSDLFPADYPDADVIIMLKRMGYRIKEVEVSMYERRGKSMHAGLEPLTYICRMSLSILRASLLPKNGLMKMMRPETLRKVAEKKV